MRDKRHGYAAHLEDSPEVFVKFFVIGDVNVDHIYHLLQLPRAGKEIHPVRAVMAPGGSGGTMAVTLALSLIHI